MAAGDYTKTVWQNGEGVGHPPINETNLNNIENKLEENDTLLYSNTLNYRFNSIKKYFWARNCKEINMFDDSSLWTGVGADIAEASDPVTGNQDVRFYDTDNVAGDIYMHDTIASFDLTEFNDEEESTTDDIIVLSVDILDHTAFSAGLTLKIGEDNLNYYSYTWPMNEDGRVTFMAKKSDFAMTGFPIAGWGVLAYIELKTTTNVNAFGKYITGLSLMMYRNDPDNDGDANPYQIYDGSSWNNFFNQSTPLWNLHYDPNKNDLCMQLLNDENDSSIWNSLKVRNSIINFVWQSIFYINYDKYTNNMTWYINSNNYFTCWIDNDDFTLTIVEAGASTPYTFTLNNTLNWGERLEIKLEKNGSTIRATLIKGYEIIKVLEHETSIDEETAGDLYFGYDDVGLCLIPDFMISDINNMDIDSWDNPKLVIKKYTEDLDTSTTIQNDDELYAYLPPNSMFEVKMNLSVDCASNTPDFKWAWTSTGITLVGNRYSTAPATSVTSVIAAEALRQTANTSLATELTAGLDSDGNARIEEEFIIKTGTNGAYIRLKWAQNVSNASVVSVIAGSYLKFTKCNILQQNL